MSSIKIISSGVLDNRDCAFPGAVQLADGTIFCAYSVGGGPEAIGCTDFSRSDDGGETWQFGGTIMPATAEPFSSNYLKFSTDSNGERLFAYGGRSYRKPGEAFGKGKTEPVFCYSDDQGATWSTPVIIPSSYNCPLEISHAACATQEGLLLAPAALLSDAEHLGEKVILRISDDGGVSWPKETVMFSDSAGKYGYLEQKLAQYAPNSLIATAWTVTLGDYQDQEDSFVLSHDGGRSWSEPRSTGIMGQTMTPIPLGDDRLLVLYNRRYGQQGIVMALVTFSEHEWQVDWDGMMYDADSSRDRQKQHGNGVDEFEDFAFGFPTAIKLNDGTFLATHWCKEHDKYIIRWTKLMIND